jgi:hypothetical protein
MAASGLLLFLRCNGGVSNLIASLYFHVFSLIT